MNIQKDTAVTLAVRIADANGKTLDEGRTPVTYLHGGYDNILPRIEAALEGAEAGFSTTLALDAADAFGPRDESLTRTIDKAEFPPGVKVGGQLEGEAADGSRQPFRVVKIKGDKVLLDGNHPLAGQALRFSVRVVAVRAASAEEITHRHVHGEHGHQH